MSARRLGVLSPVFNRAFFEAFPESTQATITTILLATNSPILNSAGLEVSTFFHQGQFIPHTGANKDLALVKYCSTGFLDQDERYRFLLDDLRSKQHQNKDQVITATDATAMFL